MTQQKAGNGRVMTIEEIREALADRVLKIVAREAGIKYHTVCDIAKGKNTNPTYNHYIALVEYLTK